MLLGPGTKLSNDAQQDMCYFDRKTMNVVHTRCALWCPEASHIVIVLYIYRTQVRVPKCATMLNKICIILTEKNNRCTPSLRNLVPGGKSYSIRSVLYIGLGSGYRSAQRRATRPCLLASNSKYYLE